MARVSESALIWQEEPDEGELELGSTVRLGYVSQSREGLEPTRTVSEGLELEGPKAGVQGRGTRLREKAAGEGGGEGEGK